MKLEIGDPKNLIEDDFIIWLKIKIRDKIISDVKLDKLKNWDNFFNNQSMYKSIYKKKILTSGLIATGSSNLDHIKSESSFYIRINPNIYVPGLDRVKLESICKTINFGTQEIAGYPIFTETFDYFAEHIQEYLDRYLRGIP